MPTTRRRAAGPVLAGAALLLVTAGCGTTPSAQARDAASQPPAKASSSSTPASPKSDGAPAGPVRLKANVDDGAEKVAVDKLVKVSAEDGTLTKVKLAYRYTDGNGAVKKGTVDGTLDADKTKWTADGRLDPAATYTLTMTGTNAQGEETTKSAKFETRSLTLAQQVYPTVLPKKGSKVGVGMPIVVHFDVPVKDRAAIEKELHVTSTPKQTGSWSWFSSTEVHYRPQTYWKSGTKVSLDGAINGVDAGNGIYGQKDIKTSFTVARDFRVKINLKTDVAKVYQDGKKVKTILVSGGKPGWQTRSGVKLIMGKEYNKTMTNEMIGAEEEYSLTAQYAMRITSSGEFLHSAPWNTANFGKRNASHGCTGMSNANAGWLYERTLVGDPVITTGSDRGVEKGNGFSDWNVSWAKYQKGSAL